MTSSPGANTGGVRISIKSGFLWFPGQQTIWSWVVFPQSSSISTLSAFTYHCDKHVTWISSFNLHHSLAIFNQCAERIFKTCNTWLFSQGHWPLFLRLSNEKMTTADTTVAIWCEWVKIIPIFVISAKNIFSVVPQHFSN